MTDDKNLSKSDVQTLSSRDGVAAFFATLGYHTGSRQPQNTSAMGITATSLIRQIRHIERLAVHDDGAEPLDLYVVELDSVTMAATHALTRALRNRAGNYLLVITDDYERLDFVLLQRTLPSSTKSPMRASQVVIRPRILTVSRRNPSQVELRVLRRFTFTEADSDAQYDKLLSAYAIADWSEPLFNNRALFSDYYLNERLPELPEWRERPEQIYHRLRELFAGLRRQSPTIEHGLATGSEVEPILEALGFAHTWATGADSMDYQLHAPEKPEDTVAVCLAYPWNRYLDGRDDSRDLQNPDDNPGARVVAILESSKVGWAIVTNGKLWRLYSSKTHSRSTNYYEMDLEETLAMADPNEAFRYFWLFFRLNAFAPGTRQRDGETEPSCFLDFLLEGSESYAKGLGERLKDRVFEHVFPHFASGFMEHLKGQFGSAEFQQTALFPTAHRLHLKQEPDEEFRHQVFNATLTLLYRLLFLLYAESRDLLPVKEVRGYWDRSLTKIKEDIAEKAGNLSDEVPGRLERTFGDSTNATGIYDRLIDLFSTIDQGSRDLNVPLYNGGLFVTNPKSDDSSPEAETTRFLMSHKIPDRYLALGLDLLARDLDDKRQDLVFIDYKSLGVRQLGSIYEGLLEFRIRVASEKMAVVKGNKTEEVITYQEAVDAQKKVLKLGRGRDAQERVYQPGEVYLENDRRERKASGSYYTPDHIVKYIVENTLGPVLADKFERLRPEFREAGRRYRQRLDEAESLGRPGSASGEQNDPSYSFETLLDRLFDLRVLDPAMGSGHFLVEAVDFICDRILGEREGFLRAFPWNPVTRYLQETRDAIIIEMERQGVTVDAGRLTDINLLKRHVLKRCVYGVDLNPMAVELAKVSLWLDCFTIGTPLSFLDHHLKCGNSLIGTTVQEVEAELTEYASGHTGNLFGGPFEGLLNSTTTMLEIARSPDATVEQAERSRSYFGSLEKENAPYKIALDMWVSQRFENKLAKEYLTLAGAELVDQIRSGGNGLSKEYRGAISRANEIAQSKRFFHWDLEFPEAFVDLERGQWKPRKEQGFDVVIGNPPYGTSFDRTEKNFWKNRFQIDAGHLNIAGAFYSAAVSHWSNNTTVGMIVPKSITFSQGWEPVVDRVLPHLACLVDVSQAFSEVLLEQVIAVCRSGSEETYSSGVMSNGSLVSMSDQRKDAVKIAKVLVTGVDEFEARLADKLVSSGGYFGDVTETFRGLGWQRFAAPEGVERLMAGKDLRRYAIRPHGSFLPESVLNENGKVKRLRQNKIVSQNIVAHIGQPVPHIRIVASLDTDATLNLDTVNNTLSMDDDWPLEALLALLNSKVYSWYMYRFIYNQAIRTMHFDAHYVARLPLPHRISGRDTRSIQELVTAASSGRREDAEAEFSRVDSDIDDWVYKTFRLTDKEILRIEDTTFHGSS